MKKFLLIGGIAFIVIAFFAAGSLSSHQEARLFTAIMKQADQGDAEAEYHIGMMYNNGIGITQDAKQAFTWFQKSAEGGDPLGAYKLGCYYAGQAGDVIPTDKAKALRYKLIAAKAGYMLAQFDVAGLYMEQKKYAEAFKWVSESAKQGFPLALYNLSVLYKDGTGTKKNPQLAYINFKLSQLAAKGEINAEAEAALKDIASGMSAEELASAEKQVQSWLPAPTPLTLQARQGLKRAEEYAKQKAARA